VTTPFAPLQISRGLIAAALGWACGIAITYAVGSLFRPLWDVAHGESWHSLHAFEVARLLLPATGAASAIGAAAFATYAPPGRYRLIETLGLIFLVTIPLEWILVGSLPPLRSRYEVDWWLHPLEVAAVTSPAVFFGLLLAVLRAGSPAAETTPVE